MPSLCQSKSAPPPKPMARDFNGSSDYIEGGSAVATAVPLTMSCWFRGASINTALMSIGVSGGTHRFAINISSGSFCQALSQAGAAAPILGTTNVVTASTTWYHACAVFASSTSRSIYTNGADKQTNTTSNTPTGLNRTVLGARYSTTLGAYHTGELADVAIWNVELTDAEVASLGTGIQADRVRPTGLVFYAPLVRDVIDIQKGLALTTSGTTVTNHPRIFK